MLKHVNSDLRSKCHINNLIFRCLCVFITRWSDNLQLLTLSNNSCFYSLSSPNKNEFFGKGQLSLNVFWSRRSKYSYCVANISLCKKASHTRQSANLICIILIVLVVGNLRGQIAHAAQINWCGLCKSLWSWSQDSVKFVSDRICVRIIFWAFVSWESIYFSLLCSLLWEHIGCMGFRVSKS